MSHLPVENIKQNKQHFYWLDLLRFVSALLVVIGHYRGRFFVEYSLLPIENKNIFTQMFYFFTRFGNEPVLVFFVLSGFLVGGKAMQRILDNDINIKSYFLDRFTRIMLPLITALLFMIFIDLIVGNSIPIKGLLMSLFSLQGVLSEPIPERNFALWSLAYEVWFYILIGCIMIIFRNKNKRNGLFAFIILTICVYIFSKLETIYLLIMLMGTFVYLIPRDNIKYLKFKISTLIFLLFIAFSLGQMTSETRGINLSYVSFLDREAAKIFLAFITSLLVYNLTLAKPKKKFWIKVESLSSKFADFSYTLYLTHFPLMSLLFFIGFPKSDQINLISISYYFVEVLISLIVAYFIYLISEKQTSKVKSYIKRRLIK